MGDLLPLAGFLGGAVLGALIAWLFFSQRLAGAIRQAQGDAATELAVLRERLEAQSAAAKIQADEQSQLTAKLSESEQRAREFENAKVALTATLEEEHEQAERDAKRVFEINANLTDARNELGKAQQENAALKTTLQGERRENQEKIALLVEAERKLTDVFKALAADTLKSNNESFLDLAKTAFLQHHETAKGELETRKLEIKALVEPVGETMKNVNAKLSELETVRAEAYGSLKEQVASLIGTEEKLRLETSRLVTALRAPQSRGRWGELQLKRVVEMAGMIEHCDFDQQQTTDTEEGKQRPDLLVRLPGNVNIVVDAKAPLLAFLEAAEATDEATRAEKLRDHARHVAAHVDKLSKKAYWDQFQNSPEFVVLFLPGEHFYTTALEHDPGLIERGVDQKVIIATPMTLISLLKAVAIGWRQERLAKNAEEISRLGKELYDRLQKMCEHLNKVGKNLRQATDAFNQTTSTFESRVLVSARRFQELGAGATEEIDAIDHVDNVPRIVQAPSTSTSGGSQPSLPLLDGNGKRAAVPNSAS